MPDPAYLRRKAELCLSIAELMSDPDSAKVARSAADRYARRAEQAEKRKGKAALRYVNALPGYFAGPSPASR